MMMTVKAMATSETFMKNPGNMPALTRDCQYVGRSANQMASSKNIDLLAELSCFRGKCFHLPDEFPVYAEKVANQNTQSQNPTHTQTRHLLTTHTKTHTHNFDPPSFCFSSLIFVFHASKISLSSSFPIQNA